jgi:beta-fructofuranosidase
MKHTDSMVVSDEMALNYHLMHPGGDSSPGDPNVAFCLDGTYHLHYILRHPWKAGESFSFVHVASPDMLHWTWQTTKLQPSFTGHGMFSGTGFITKEGKPAAIYAGVGTPGDSYIAVSADNQLSRWEKPYPVVAKGGPDGQDIHLLDDPDGFLIGDTYYAFSAVAGLPLCKSSDLTNWTYVGGLLKYDMPDVALGEDLSCANLYPLGDKWMLLCISHSMGCRYYLGDWDAEAEHFVPETHGRMNWRRSGQSLTQPFCRDFFAPESVLTADGRRVMWAWLCTLDPQIRFKSVQSLPRELSLAEDGSLRIHPLRELESLRFDAVTLDDLEIGTPAEGGDEGVTERVAEIDSDSFELRISVDRSEAERKRFGLLLFAGEGNQGLPVILRPEAGTICLGETEAPFAVADLPEGEDLELRIFVDKYLVEVFVNGRQAALTTFMEYRDGSQLKAYSFAGRHGTPTKIRKLEIWKLKPTNQGFFEARENRLWAPDIDG